MKKIITNEIYHSTYELSNSKITKIHNSIRDFTHGAEYESDSMDFGSLVHDCVLDQPFFNKNYIPLPDDFDGRLKEGKALMKEVQEMGMKAVKSKEHKAALSVRERLLKHPLTRNILERTEKEVAYFSTFKKFGKEWPVKCKPDAHDNSTMMDLKTTRSFHPDDFKWSIRKFGYARQAAWYPDVYEHSQGERLNDFLLVVIKNSPPYNLDLRLIDTESTDLGRKQYLSALEKLSRFIDKKMKVIEEIVKDFPGTVNSNETLSILKLISDKPDLFDEELVITTTGLPHSDFYSESQNL